MSDEELAKMKDAKKVASHLHNYTHGINSDPITMLAILFSYVLFSFHIVRAYGLVHLPHICIFDKTY